MVMDNGYSRPLTGKFFLIRHLKFLINCCQSINYFSLILKKISHIRVYLSGPDMKKHKLFLIIIFLLFCLKLSSQNFLITEPKLQFDGHKLSITYDLITKGKSDLFSIWVEIRDQDGDPIRAYSYRGEFGDSIKPGNNKIITWVPEEDAFFLDEDVTVELKGELYERSFNKGTMVALSAVVPGLGQTKIKEKPWWLASIPAYGALAGGVIYNMKFADTYDAYHKTLDGIERDDLWAKAQQERNISGALFIGAAVVGAANLVWIAATPNKYKPLQHAKVSINSVPFDHDRITYVSIKVDF